MIYTFYSYKGGVGRSLALACAAHAFAERGLRVLAVDFDLEAPGLERYFFDGDEARSRRAQPGLIDLVLTYRRALTSDAEFERAEFRDWRAFRQTVRDPVNQRGGVLDLMTAGQREGDERMREYALTVRSFDWQDFFHNWKGDRFFEWLRRQWSDPQLGYDVVLVDSRTGVTEMGGVCAYQLADAAVLLCAPNYQNLDGTRKVVSDFLSDGVLGLRRGRPLDILALPARLEPDHPKREQFLLDFERELGSDAMPAALALAGAGLSYRSLALPYQQAFSISERLVGETPADDGGDITRLVDALTLLAPEGSRLGAQRDEALARLKGQAAPSTAADVGLHADTTRISSGFDALIECASVDLPLVRALKEALEQQGFRISLGGYDVGPGDAWSDAYDLALRYSSTVLLCFGKRGVSRWSERVVARVREMGHARLVPVLLPGADDSAPRALALEASQALDLRGWRNAHDSGELLQPVLRLLGRGAERASATPAVGPARDPYPGPRAWREDEASSFAGRADEVAALIARLREHDIVVLQGAAQVGKSSLLHAGLLPALRRGVEGLPPPQQLVVIDAKGAAALELPRRSACLAAIDHLDADPEAPHLAALLDWITALPPGSKALLVARGAWRDAQLHAIDAALRDRRVATYVLQPLAGAALHEAIDTPARHAGHLLEPGLAERLIESAGLAHSRALQLQLALTRLWDERRRGWLTNKCLDAAGHLGGLFVAHRRRVLDTCSEAERVAAAVMFKTLSALDADQRLTPNTLPWPVLDTVEALRRVGAERLRNRLADAGLIDLWRSTEPLGAPMLMVALARPNPLQYFDSDGQIPDLAFFIWRAGSSPYAQHWATSDRHDDALLTGRALADAEHWRAQRADELTAPELALIEASAQARARLDAKAEADHVRQLESAQRLAQVEHERAELQSQAAEQARIAQGVLRERWRLMLGIASGAVVMALVAAYGWYQVFQQSGAKEIALREAIVINAASEAQATLLKLRAGSDVRALLQLAAARRMSDKPEVASLAIEGLLAQPGLRHITELPGDVGMAYAFNAGGTHLAYVRVGGVLAVMEVASGRVALVPTPRGEATTFTKGTVNRLALSDDARTIIVHVGDLPSDVGRFVAIYRMAGGPSKLVALGRSASLVPSDLDQAVPLIGSAYAAIADGAVLRVWSLREPDAPTWQVAQLRGAHALAFNAAENRLAVVDAAGTMAVLDLQRRSVKVLAMRWPEVEGVKMPTGLTVVPRRPELRGIALSDDAKRIAIASRAGVHVFDTDTGNPLRRLGGDEASTIDLMRFAPDGQRLVTYGASRSAEGGVLRMWDVASGRRLGEATRGHDKPIAALAFTPNGASLLTTSADGTLRRWNARLDLPFGKLLDGAQGRTWGLDYLPDGKTLVSASEDGRLRRWNVAQGTLEAASPAGLLAEKEYLMAVAVGPDGRSIATGSSTGSLRLWRTDTLESLAQAAGAHSGPVYGIGFLPGDRVASGGGEGTVRLWNTALSRALEPVQTAAAASSVASLATQPTAGLVAAGGEDGGVVLWRASPAGLAESIRSTSKRSFNDRIDFLAFGLRGRELIVGGGTPTVIDTETGKTLARRYAGLANPWSLAVSPDGRFLAGGSDKGELRLWNYASGTVASPVIRLPRGARAGDPALDVGGVAALAFSADGRWLGVGGDAGLIWLMPHPDRWLDELCTRVGRNMSDAEWKRWMSPALTYMEQCPGLPKPADADTPDAVTATAAAAVASAASR